MNKREFSKEQLKEIEIQIFNLIGDFRQTSYFNDLSNEQRRNMISVINFMAVDVYKKHLLKPEEWTLSAILDHSLVTVPFEVTASPSYYASYAPCAVKFLNFLEDKGILKDGKNIAEAILDVEEDIVAKSRPGENKEEVITEFGFVTVKVTIPERQEEVNNYVMDEEKSEVMNFFGRYIKYKELMGRNAEYPGLYSEGPDFEFDWKTFYKPYLVKDILRYAFLSDLKERSFVEKVDVFLYKLDFKEEEAEANEDVLKSILNLPLNERLVVGTLFQRESERLGIEVLRHPIAYITQEAIRGKDQEEILESMSVADNVISVSLMELEMKKMGREDLIKQARQRKLTNKKIGKNAPCPCGSGKQYKRCCGKR